MNHRSHIHIIAMTMAVPSLCLVAPRTDANPFNVQVSSDLVNWVDGAAHTEVVSDGPFGLVVRDKTPASAHNGRRFMRVQIEALD